MSKSACHHYLSGLTKTSPRYLYFHWLQLQYGPWFPFLHFPERLLLKNNPFPILLTVTSLVAETDSCSDFKKKIHLFADSFWSQWRDWKTQIRFRQEENRQILPSD